MKIRSIASGLFIFLFTIALAPMLARQAAAPRASQLPFRPPAVPLVAVDPYFSIWSFASHLTYDCTRHWTGEPMVLQSMVRVDGKPYRLMGAQPSTVTPARQLRLRVFPTRTKYEFDAGPVHVGLTFMTADLPHDLDVLSRPVTYLTWTVQSTDGMPHRVSIFFDATASLVVSAPEETVVWSRERAGNLSVLRMGTKEQPVLGRAGDHVKINWGYLYAAAPEGVSLHNVVAPQRNIVESFARHGLLPGTDDKRMPRSAEDGWPAVGFSFRLGRVGAQPVSRYLILAYDEIYPIEYFHIRLRPYWQRRHQNVEILLETAARNYTRLQTKCREFDRNLVADLTRAGGRQYALLAALAYRQVFAANKLAVGPKGRPLMFLKEISSCGCAQTADVIYPESPLLLLLNPKLLEDSLIPLLDYARSGNWPYPYAPHDLGTYPLVNARAPSEMESMPVEESGNMLLMIAGIAMAEGNASFAGRYWALLSRWAGYLRIHGLDPGNQLSTDDFTGMLAHNANLSLKAIEALGAYALLARMLGKQAEASAYQKTGHAYAQRWMEMANDGDHTRLAFDRPGTWSQKYNLVWDRVLGLNLFPPHVAQNELAWYQKHATYFGFPLDSRMAYTKLDWESWSAALDPSGSVFRSLFSGVYHFAAQTPTRVPLSDWYWTTDGTQVGFQARPVVGALYMKMLTDPALWQKWARR